MTTTIEYLGRHEMGARFGYARISGGKAQVEVRFDLPEPARSFVTLHELRHIEQYKAGKGDQSWLWLEVKANAVAGLLCPSGLFLAALLSLAPSRLAYYWHRFMIGR